MEYASGQVCTAECREPCQAGNRAALSGLFWAMQVACPFTYFTAFAVFKKGKRGDGHGERIQGAIQKV